MKKISTLFAAALLSVSAMATDYTEPLVVDVNGTSVSSGDVKVSVDKEIDGTYTFALKDFKFGAMNVGDIVVENVEAVECGKVTSLTADETITISLGEVEVLMNAQVCDGKLNAYLIINGVEGMDINVSLGEKVDELGQIPNSGFEKFHTASVSMGDGEPATSDEPNAWHSFMSASGNPVLVYLAGYAPHTFISDDVRPGSKGKHSVKLLALDMGIAIANGTITTGRMNTGSTTASDVTSNYAWSDLSETEVDANGDPFYTVMTNFPDSIKMWVKYGQGTPNTDHPYATVSAVLTDGTRYQDPESSTYTNVIAKANNPKIESTNGEWKEISVPFDYSYIDGKEDVTPKNLQVTISTNADAGQGSNNDSLYVDDVELVYNSKLSTITYKGTEIANFDPNTFDYTIETEDKVNFDDFKAVSDGIGALIDSSMDETDKEQTVYFTVTSNDLKNVNLYTINIKNTQTSINSTKANASNKVVNIYNLNGQSVKSMKTGEVYVVKYADGKTQKVARK